MTIKRGCWNHDRFCRGVLDIREAVVRGCLYEMPSGIPGLRDSTYYRLTGSTQFRVFRWPSWLHPSWTQEREAELLEFYGGRDSAGFVKTIPYDASR